MGTEKNLKCVVFPVIITQNFYMPQQKSVCISCPKNGTFTCILEPDTTNGNFGVRITAFIVTTIYTLHRDKVFVALPVELNCHFYSQ
jgi:hypothetical protein